MNSKFSKAILKTEMDVLQDSSSTPHATITLVPTTPAKDNFELSLRPGTLQETPSSRLNELDPKYLRNLEFTYEEKYHETKEQVEQEFKQVPWYILTQEELQKAQMLKETFVQGPTNQETMNCLLRTSFPNGYKQSEYLLESQSIIDTILARGNQVFDKDSGSGSGSDSGKNFDTSSLEKEKNITLLADEITKRNVENLHNSCKRDVFY